MGEERKNQRKGNHPIAFGTREKGMKDDGNGGEVSGKESNKKTR